MFTNYLGPVGGMVNHRNSPIKSDNRFCRCRFTWDGPNYRDRHVCVNEVDVCIVCTKVSSYFARVCKTHGGVFMTDRYAEYGSCKEGCKLPPSIEDLLDGL